MLLTPPDFADDYLDLTVLQQLDPALHLAEYKKCLREADALLYQDFKGGRNITRLVKIRAWVVEQLLLRLWRHYVNQPDLALVGVGGFGRGDLQPHSDVDLLVLHHEDLNEEALSTFIQSLWDIGLDIGHAVRTVDQCEDMAREDVTVATNLLEGRFMIGDTALYEDMRQRIHSDGLWTGRSYFQAKYAEQKQRYKKCGDTAYHLEPNIKEGPGGLRDIHMVTWVAQRHFKVKSMHGLVDVGFLQPDEYISLQKGRRYLWKVRFALHHLAGRKEDRLLFDHQKPIAEIFGYEDDEESLGVEKFMQFYYRNAMLLERLNLRLLQLFKENILYSDQPRKLVDLGPHFQAVNSYLEIKSPDLFQTTPTVFFELFQLMQTHDWLEGIRADTVRALRQCLYVVNDDFCNDPVIQDQFIEIFKQPRGIFRQLLEMNRLGLLGHYLPVFGHIVGRMQYDLFHMYTVDQHSLFVLRNMRQIMQSPDQHPLGHQIMQAFDKPYILYLAALFHDIAKGRGGDHSELGAVDATQFGEQHRLPKADTELLSWLVRYHLIMSVVAQKQDISDAEVIRKFTELMGDQRHLDALYILTIADISGTDPKLWNAFKDSLLRGLYQRAKAELAPQDVDVIAVKKERAKADLEHIPDQIIEDFWKKTDDRFFDHSSTEQINHVIKQAISQPDQASVQITDRHSDGFGIIIYAKDYTGLFSHVVQVFSVHQINVVDARIYSTLDNKALDYFHCLGQYDNAKLEALKNDLLNALKNQSYDQSVTPRLNDLRERHFEIEPEINFSAGRDATETRMEVICSDQSGLLAQIAEVMLKLKITIHGAKIATFGNKVEDIFWLSVEKKSLSQVIQNQLKEKLMRMLDDNTSSDCQTK
ncbi:[protein-PII] uridylyltransferase [Marinicella sp. W31]|uniref:[protein-PII] uridylyltransferase n=1 Tax=Marinicella sp. W31 TaxID=3023713 RepID=UPI003756FFB0